MKKSAVHLLTCALFAFGVASLAAPARASDLPVTRATLSNGLQIVVVHDALAPVVTTILNYKVGSDEQTVDGQAHALEHMMFRGSATVSSSQLMDTVDITGGDFDADTQDSLTQYNFTVPSQYLDIALRLERSRATGLTVAPDQWAQERGAITQEVTRDNSDAIYRLFDKMQSRMLAGTPYAKNGLGTVRGFAHDVNANVIRAFYRTWYHPNNAVYVVVGDVDGPATVAKITALFGDVPRAPLPEKPRVTLRPLKAVTYRDTSDQPFTAVLLGYRVPGYDSKDYAASQVLSDVLNSQRGDLFAIQAAGQAYQVGYFEQTYNKVGVGILFAAVPITTKPEVAAKQLTDVIGEYRKNGVPADLVEAAKRRAIAQLESNGNSVEGLAFEWSQAVAQQGLSSPGALLSAYQNVSVADVNRVVRASLDDSTVVTAFAVPKNVGAMSSGGGGPKEDVSVPPSKHEPLPVWARDILAKLSVPQQTLSPVDMTLSNGVRLIVQPEHVTHYVTVSGRILNSPDVQEPQGQEGVAGLAAALLPYGTTTYDRVGFQKQLDDIAASTDAGTDFDLSVLSNSFDRGVQLLADEELHPAFDPKAFAIVKRQTVQGLADEAESPDHLAAVALANALYPAGDPQRRFATPVSAGAVTLDDVKTWFASSYRPDLTTIVVVGDVSPDQAKASFEKYFGSWTATGAKPNVYPAPVQLNTATSVTVPANGRVQSSVQLVESIGLLRNDPDWAAMEVANTALTGGFYSSLLYHDLREVHGYAYSIGSTIAAGKVRSTFAISYGCDPQNVLPAQQQTVAILKQLQQQGLEPDRLTRAKAMLMGDVPIQQASYDGVKDLLLNYAVRDLPLDENLIDAQRELAATSQSVQAAFAKWIRPDAFVRVIVGPGPK